MYLASSLISVLRSNTPIQDDIDFDKKMAMFSDEGQTPYPFTATYKDQISHKDIIQTGYTENHKMVLEVKPC